MACIPQWYNHMVTDYGGAWTKLQHHSLGPLKSQHLLQPSEIQPFHYRTMFPQTHHIGDQHKTWFPQNQLHHILAPTDNSREFLGLTQYITTFLSALTEYTSVLTPLTTKECNWVFPTWITEHQKVFESIKCLVLGTDCLTIIDYEDKELNIYITTDQLWCFTFYACY